MAAWLCLGWSLSGPWGEMVLNLALHRKSQSCKGARKEPIREGHCIEHRRNAEGTERPEHEVFGEQGKESMRFRKEKQGDISSEG